MAGFSTSSHHCRKLVGLADFLAVAAETLSDQPARLAAVD